MAEQSGILTGTTRKAFTAMQQKMNKRQQKKFLAQGGAESMRSAIEETMRRGADNGVKMAVTREGISVTNYNPKADPLGKGATFVRSLAAGRIPALRGLGVNINAKVAAATARRPGAKKAAAKKASAKKSAAKKSVVKKGAAKKAVPKKRK